MSDRSPDEAYRQLQRLAREQGRNTQELLELYVDERFLARLSGSEFRNRFVLKGGMLLAVLEARRATRDADLLALGIDNSEGEIRSVVAEIAGVELGDGVEFGTRGMTLTTIREEAPDRDCHRRRGRNHDGARGRQYARPRLRRRLEAVAAARL